MLQRRGSNASQEDLHDGVTPVMQRRPSLDCSAAMVGPKIVRTNTNPSIRMPVLEGASHSPPRGGVMPPRNSTEYDDEQGMMDRLHELQAQDRTPQISSGPCSLEQTPICSENRMVSNAGTALCVTCATLDGAPTTTHSSSPSRDPSAQPHRLRVDETGNLTATPSPPARHSGAGGNRNRVFPAEDESKSDDGAGSNQNSRSASVLQKRSSTPDKDKSNEKSPSSSSHASFRRSHNKCSTPLDAGALAASLAKLDKGGKPARSVEAGMKERQNTSPLPAALNSARAHGELGGSFRGMSVGEHPILGGSPTIGGSGSASSEALLKELLKKLDARAEWEAVTTQTLTSLIMQVNEVAQVMSAASRSQSRWL